MQKFVLNEAEKALYKTDTNEFILIGDKDFELLKKQRDFSNPFLTEESFQKYVSGCWIMYKNFPELAEWRGYNKRS